MQPRARALSLIFGVACVVAACAHAPDASRTSQTTTTGATFTLAGNGNERGRSEAFDPSSPELSDPTHPANRLGTATCERKLECDAIGEGKTYATSQTCLMATRRHAHEELEQLDCENGLDDARLNDCIQAVRIAECASLDQLGRIDACSKARLCAR